MSRAGTCLGMVLILVLALPSGCPLDDAGTSGPPPSEVRAGAQSTASVGEMVTLTAEAVAEGANGRLTYEWHQVFGRVVTLIGADTAEARFEAPSFGKDERLRFRVDVRVGRGEIRSAEIEVMVTADPEYAFDGVPGGGGGGGGGNGDGGGPRPDDDYPTPHVQIETSKGTIMVRLDRRAAPITVENFLRYVEDRHYDGTIFHRVIPDFVVQGGGFDTSYNLKSTRPPIANESANGLRNERATIAMARTGAPDSATSQFYFNLVNNPDLDTQGYAVFGRVVTGLDVIDAIAAEETTTRAGVGEHVPVNQIVIQRARRFVTSVEEAASGGGTRKQSGE